MQIIKIPKQLTLNQLENWLQTVQTKTFLVETLVDGADLEQFDSATLSALLCLIRSSQAPLKFVNLPAKLLDLATVYGIQEILAEHLVHQ